MKPVSPAPVDGDLLTISITADGRPLDSHLTVIGVEVWNALNAIPKAKILLQGGTLSEAPFSPGAFDALQPGKAIEIGAGYGLNQDAVFSGIVVAQGIELGDQPAIVVVDAAGHAVTMTAARKTAVFTAVTDAALVGQLISASGFTPDVGTTTVVHDAVLQNDTTDWDFVVLRAAINGMVVTTDAGTVTVKAPDTLQPPVLAVTYGESMLAFKATIDPPRSGARARGQVTFPGSALARPGSMIELSGVGGSFDDGVFISAVHHDIADRRWTTAVEFGHVPNSSPAAPLNDDPGFPIVLGSLSGTGRVITIRTPGQQVISLNDTSGEIHISDANQNSVTLGSSGISIDSRSNLVIAATGHIEVKAGAGLSVQTKGDVTCEGLRVDVEATTFRAHGQQTADVASSGIVTVQGALVKIN